MPLESPIPTRCVGVRPKHATYVIDIGLVVNGSDVLLDQDTSLVSHLVEEDVLSQGIRLSGADRRRNERLGRLRVLVAPGNAILAVDLADVKQHAVLCDHDSRVLARWAPKGKAWQLGALLDRAVAAAAEHGFMSVTLACEPTGHRWQILAQMAAERGLPMVCIQPLAMRRARENEDYTTGKTDAKDAVIIARLAAKLHCYQPEKLEQTWAALREVGARRARLIVEHTGQQAQVRDLLECVWPAALAAAPTTLFDVGDVAGVPAHYGADKEIVAITGSWRPPSLPLVMWASSRTISLSCYASGRGCAPRSARAGSPAPHRLRRRTASTTAPTSRRC